MDATATTRSRYFFTPQTAAKKSGTKRRREMSKLPKTSVLLNRVQGTTGVLYSAVHTPRRAEDVRRECPTALNSLCD